MPKSSLHVLTWSKEHQCYELTTSGQFQRSFRPEDESAWFAWVLKHTAFAFEGHSGHLSVVKEARPRGAGYWYAYSRQARRTRKRYLGRTATLSHLEQVAKTLMGEDGTRISWGAKPSHEAFSEPERSLSHTSNKGPISLLATKLVPPQLPALLVERERLLNDLNAVSAHQLLLLSAPAGSGKTTLLATWASRKQAAEQLVAWLSLDTLDNDPKRFWIAIIAALRACQPALGEKALALLYSSQQPLLMTVLLDLINELSRRNEKMILILDDYHLITEQSIHASLHFLLEHLPSNLHLVLSTRTDPALPLPQLRVRGQLVEIRDLDLRFRLKETNSFLTQMVENPLTQEEVNLLEARTEGWIAGLQLAALALRKCEDRATFLQAYTGSYRYLLDYIQYEILQRQPELMQHFLLQIAVLPHMNAALCQAVTCYSNIQTCQLLLEELQRNNLFVIPLDEQQQWYRFHDLFREALLACLQARQPELLPTLQIRAACWYEQQGLLPEAIEAALQARDFPRAVDLIERVLAPHSFRNAYPLLRRWLECIPEETLTASPTLSFAYAEALVFTSDRRNPAIRTRVAQPLESAERGFRAQKDNQKLAQVLSLRATLAFFQNDLPIAFTLAHQMLLLQPASEHHWRGSSLLMLGIEALLAGEMERARTRILEARLAYQVDHSLPGLLITPLLLGEIAFGQGEMRQASQFYHQVQAEAENAAEELFQQQLTSETGTREMFFTRLALEGLAQLAYERNELDTADQLLSQARELGGFQAEELHFLTSGSLLQARILHARGQSTQSQEWLSQLVVQACSPQFLREIRTCMARIALAVGDLTKAEDWSQTAEYSDVALWRVRQEEEALLLARLRITQAESEQARRILAPWKAEAEAQNRLRSVLEIQILEALAYFARNQLSEAIQMVLLVLRRTQGEKYQRLFLDEGQAMQALLKSTLPHIQEKPLATSVRNLLHTFAQEQTQRTPGQEKLSEPLSSQEQRVLHLLVEGCSNQEIAKTLIISVNTVKAHLKNLYRKLDVVNRVQAAKVARSQQLL